MISVYCAKKGFIEMASSDLSEQVCTCQGIFWDPVLALEPALLCPASYTGGMLLCF